jgi:hypothetical protein
MSDVLGSGHGDDAIIDSRVRLFTLLLMRLRALHANRPESFYIGQEYVEDKVRIDCTIAATLRCPGYVKQFDFWLHGTKVNGTQYGNVLLLRADRKISMRLWDDLRLKNVGQQFIIGYLNSLMPTVNRHLIDNRYREGHPLSRTFAIFELADVSVTARGRRLWLEWPRSISSFPPTVQLSDKITALYVRDYIDAMHAFFLNEYDDCIRRVITATENFLEMKNWKIKRSRSRMIADIFKRLLRIDDMRATL